MLQFIFTNLIIRIILQKDLKQLLYELKDVSFSYQLGSLQVEALKNLSLKIPEKSLITLSGPSGSGKSTLINLLGLIEPVQNGDIFFQNESLSVLKSAKKNEIRKYHIGFIFQQFHLIPVLTAEENISYFLTRQKLPKKIIKQRVADALETVGLTEHKMKKPSQLSGGQKQRVAIARALAKNPKVIIADEPTASLDQKTGKEVMEVFEHLVKEKNVTVIITTHDPMVQSYANYKIHIVDGKIQEAVG